MSDQSAAFFVKIEGGKLSVVKKGEFPRNSRFLPFTFPCSDYQIVLSKKL
jgi:hypothetical protein